MAPNCQGYGGYSWNHSLFADPKAFTEWLHTDQHLKLMVNTHDYIGLDPCQVRGNSFQKLCQSSRIHSVLAPAVFSTRSLNLHVCIYPSGQAFYREMAEAMGVDPSTNATLQCAWTNKTFSNAVYEHVRNWPTVFVPVSL